MKTLLCWLLLISVPLATCQCRTRWFDRDDPSGVGDFEDLSDLLKENPGQLCPHPIGIEAKTVDGVPASETGQTFISFDVVSGFICENSATQSCLDYEVLFTCPESFCSSKCETRWFDRDDPSGVGDFEDLPDLLKENPGQICTNPIGIEAQTVDGVPASATGQTFGYYDASNGFSCVNSATQSCLDYKVLFICPDSFCSSDCRTRWFDRDDPSGVGDFEDLPDLLKENPGQLCPHPIGIEAQTVAGVPASQTGQTFATYDATNGFSCVNSASQRCLDYKVLFTCPASFCSSQCKTRWFDRDDPSGVGDFEDLSDLLKENPGQLCTNPIGIEAQTVDGVPASVTGQTFGAYDATYGFSCVNSASQMCLDYEVLFLCPASFCQDAKK